MAGSKGLFACVFFFLACIGSAQVCFAFKHSSNKLGQHLRQQAQNEKHIMAAADFPQTKYNTRLLQENYLVSFFFPCATQLSINVMPVFGNFNDLLETINVQKVEFRLYFFP